jgi:hypothetical protein
MEAKRTLKSTKAMPGMSAISAKDDHFRTSKTMHHRLTASANKAGDGNAKNVPSASASVQMAQKAKNKQSTK